MSTIFGQYNLTSNLTCSSKLEKALDAMNTWHPDTTAIWKDKEVGLGHLMLYTSLESTTETLPFFEKESNLTITADARIDNRAELIHKLNITITNKHRVPISDSQLILESYKKWGIHCPQYLIGDFAFAIWDKNAQQLFCARDHIGIRPFFYYFEKDFFAFSSQKRGLLCFSEVNQNWNKDFIHEVLFSGQPYDKHKTFYQSISKLPGGNSLTVSKNGISIQEYWRLDKTKPEILPNDEAYIEKAKILLEEAVKCRTKSLYPIGSQLSGGLDSSGVAILAAKYAKKQKTPFSVFCNVLPEHQKEQVFPFKDEREFIAAACEAGKIEDINFTKLDQKKWQHYVEQQLELLDGLADIDASNHTQLHAELAMPKGVRTLFSGYTGDELVTMDYFFASMNELFIEKKWLTFCKEFIAAGRNRPKTIVKYFLLYCLHYRGQKFLHWYRRLKGNPSEWFDPTLFSVLNPKKLKNKIEELIETNINNYNRTFKTHKDAEIWCFSKNNGIPYRIEGEVITAIQHRINMVYPLADVRLVEFFHHAPCHLKRKNGSGRYLYRTAMKGILPEIIRSRGKSGGYTTMPSYYPSIKKFHSQIRNELLLFKKEKVLNELLDFDKLIKMWDLIKEDNYDFGVTGYAALSLLYLTKNKTYAN